jgi:hypothetical protein
MSIQYIALHDGKQVGMRTSTVQIFTHVLLGRPCYEDAIEVNSRHWNHDAEDFAYYAEALAGTNKWPSGQNAERELGGARTAQTFQAMRAARRIDHIEKNKDEGYYDTFAALAWCGNRDLAEKEQASYTKSGYYTDLTVVSATVL